MIGPSIVSFEETSPMDASPVIFLALPSFILISKTDDNLPPYSAGIPPLISLTSLIASPLKTETKPEAEHETEHKTEHETETDMEPYTGIQIDPETDEMEWLKNIRTEPESN